MHQPEALFLVSIAAVAARAKWFPLAKSLDVWSRTLATKFRLLQPLMGS